MTQPVIQRVDLDALTRKPDASIAGRQASHHPQMVRWFIVPLSILLCIVLSLLTIYSSNAYRLTLTSTLIAVAVLATLFVMVLALNPILRLMHVGRWLSAEAMGRLARIQGGAGKLALGALLGVTAAAGPSLFAGLLAILIGLTLVTAATALVAGRRSRAGLWRVGWAAGQWCAAWLLGLGVAMAILAMGLPWWVMLALPAMAAAVYVSLWTLTTRSFTRAELMTLMAALVVSSGVSTFGLTEQLVPLITTPYNPEWNTPQARWDKELHPNLRQELYITDAAAIQVYREGLRTTTDGQVIVTPSESQTGWEGVTAWTAHYWEVACNLPWHLWLPPLAYWMVFVLGCYALFYCLTYTMVDFWVGREKLIFPLAQLQEAILPDASGDRWMPALFRSPGFWSALLIVAGVLSYNTAVRFGWLGDMGLIPQGMDAVTVTEAFKGTFLEGIAGDRASGLRVVMIFTAVGIAFLLPLEISFSIWFYYLLSRVLVLVLVGAGHGRNTLDFPSDWLYTQNEVTAQGAGAILMFSIIMLYRSVKDTGTQVFSRTQPTSQKLLTGLPVIGLVASMTVLTMWIWWVWQWQMGYLLWAAVFVAFITLMTLGLMRITAEGGIYWFQSHSSFFHFWKMLSLGKFLPGSMIGPLLPIYSVMFLDIKTFMAPNLINSAKMHKDVGGSRALYHLNMVLTILAAVGASIGFALVMAYARGAQRMHTWFYSSGPRSTMNTAQQAASSVPEFNTWTASWATGGALWVIISVLARRTLFWFPHPVGYVMLINPMIHTLWFSFFVGWICKKLVVQYGGKSTFDKTRQIFIGIILGEVLAIAGWSIYTLVSGQVNTYLSLNNTF